MEIVLNKIISEIQHQEDKLSSQMMQTADEALPNDLIPKGNAVYYKDESLTDRI